MKKFVAAISVIALSFIAFSSPVSAATPTKKLLWSQEFNEAAGSAPNPKFFDYDLGGGG